MAKAGEESLSDHQKWLAWLEETRAICRRMARQAIAEYHEGQLAKIGHLCWGCGKPGGTYESLCDGCEKAAHDRALLREEER